MEYPILDIRNEGGLVKLPDLVKACDLFVYLKVQFRSFQFEEVPSSQIFIRAKRTGQRFGDMKVEGSRAFQGIICTMQSGMEQSFGTLTATGDSTAAQGQMDANSLALMFGNRHTPRTLT